MADVKNILQSVQHLFLSTSFSALSCRRDNSRFDKEAQEKRLFKYIDDVKLSLKRHKNGLVNISA